MLIIVLMDMMTVTLEGFQVSLREVARGRFWRINPIMLTAFDISREDVFHSVVILNRNTDL